MKASSERRWDEQASDEGSEETSGVFVSLHRPIVDVAVGELYSPGLNGEPTPVYATPYMQDGKNRIRYERDFYLGTSFPTGIIVANDWEDEMSGASVPEGLIAKCRAYLAERAL
jgi:hypothetical protein